MKRILSLTFTLATLSITCLSCSSYHNERCTIDFAPAKCTKCNSSGRQKCICLDKFRFNQDRDSIYDKNDKGEDIKLTDDTF